MQNKFKAIGFDWSGVMFFHTVHFRRDASHYLNIPESELSTAYFKYNHLSNLHNMSSLEFWTTVFTELGRASEARGFVEFLNRAPVGKLNQEMIKVVQLLGQKGYKTGLFSNNTSLGAEEARVAGGDDIFEVALFSAELAVMKPDPKAFQMLADKLGVDVTEMIFVDDSPKCFERASEIGFYPILYKNNISEFLNHLKDLDILTQDDIYTLKS